MGSHMEEFEADQFALRISGVLAGHRTLLRNPYLESGAGGVIMLMALDTLRAVEHALGFSDRGRSDTHPKLSLRVGKFDSVALLQPEEFARLKRFRLAAERVMTLVHDLIVPAIPPIPAEDLRKLAELRPTD
jgi:hypothetical protein